MTLAIGIDIGGTKVAGGVVDEDGGLLVRMRRESPARDPHAIVDVVADLVTELCAADEVGGAEVVAVGIGAAGYVSRDRSSVVYAPNLPGWRHEPLQERLSERLGLRVVVENDANAAAWGEYRHGSGAGARCLLMATIGTGIGGAVIIDGELFRGAFGGAGEIGHIRLVQDGRRCACGLKGCWEIYASGTALTREARRRAKANPENARILLDLADGRPERITGELVSEAAEKDDPVAIEAFDEIEWRIGEGLASLAAVLDPDVIVIGGGVSEAHDLTLDQIGHSYTHHVSGGVHRPAPELRRAVLGNDAGIIGVADLARA